jgi:two-component system CheB/CheR fusion protein
MSTLDVAAGNKGLSVTLRVDPDVPSLVLGDEGRLRQVLVNLVGNAVKFTEQGEVGVLVGLAEAGMLGSWEAGTRGEHPGVQASKRPGGVRLLFAVRDTGIGIPPENLSSLFESFSQATRSTHAKYGGTGLGLSIARQLVDLMGGRIWAESQPGNGSIFRFMLELSEASEPTVPADGEPEPGSGWTVRPLRVLLAEDNPVNQLLVRELLSQDGHEVVVAEDGRAALEALSRGGPFDVVLMDVQMPEMDGMEATRLIRDGTLPRIPRGIPVVALTAHALRGDRERFLDAGMDEYLSKPIRLEEFYRVLARVGSRSRNCE